MKAFLKRIDEPCGNCTAVKELHGCRSPIGIEPASKIRVGGQRLQRIPESCHVAWRDNDSRVMATHDEATLGRALEAFAGVKRTFEAEHGPLPGPNSS